MTDIVAKLLDFSIGSSGTLRTEAAAEIERLRDQLATSQGLCTQFENAVADDLGELLGLRAELDRLRAASEWRDISTAPRDGTWVLVASEDLYPCDAQWAETDLNTGWYDIGGFFSTQPTHWQPLLAPPQRNEVTK